MDCGALAWYEQQDEALQTRVRMLACFTANLQGLDWRRVLPGASKGARDDPDMFDRIVDHILAPLLSERMQQAVRRSLEDGGYGVHLQRQSRSALRPLQSLQPLQPGTAGGQASKRAAS